MRGKIALFLVSCLAITTSCLAQKAPTHSFPVKPGSNTIAQALRDVREARRIYTADTLEDFTISLEPGIYQLDEPVFIRPQDAGKANSRTIIKGVQGQTIISGGVVLTGWKASGMKDIMVADLPANARPELIRQLWVNDKKAIRAQTPDTDTLSRIISWNKKAQTCRIPRPSVRMPANIEGVEMIIQQWWAIAFLRLKSVKDLGDSLELSFMQPESRVQSQHPWPAPWISKKTGNSPFFLANSLAFLDQPGEWYCDARSRKVYYMPRVGEQNIEAYMPILETLFQIEGDVDNTVDYLNIEGITFKHTAWARPSSQGLVSIQAGMPLRDAYHLEKVGTPYAAKLENLGWIDRPEAAVSFKNVRFTKLSNCRFEHTASTALDYREGTYEDLAEGNIFYDIGGTAILAGTFSDPYHEIHKPFNPSDPRRLCRRLQIRNNYINGATTEDWSCVGIGAGYVQEIEISHNEVANVNYSAISLGWGWSKMPNAMRDNRVSYNYLHHYANRLYDVAAIYTLSAQPGTVISNNLIENIYKAPQAHDPHHWFYLYTDEGSSDITVRDNRTPSTKYLQNANGPGNVWANNGPDIEPGYTSTTGLELEWQRLRSKRPFKADRTPINRDEKENPMIWELVYRPDHNKQKLQTNLPHEQFVWSNHEVLFTSRSDSAAWSKILGAISGVDTIKTYSHPFYSFDRSICTNQKQASEWQNIVLTANLVADTAKQNEYLEYHRTQFQKWPEVAKGFCAASFQRLLVYKTGRQLMLIISIPVNEFLDKLNPLTTKDNPKVDDWNNIMATYQEGIPGTRPGETWVFLQPITNSKP